MWLYILCYSLQKKQKQKNLKCCGLWVAWKDLLKNIHKLKVIRGFSVVEQLTLSLSCHHFWLTCTAFQRFCEKSVKIEVKIYSVLPDTWRNSESVSRLLTNQIIKTRTIVSTVVRKSLQIIVLDWHQVKNSLSKCFWLCKVKKTVSSILFLFLWTPDSIPMLYRKLTFSRTLLYRNSKRMGRGSFGGT